MQTRSAEPIDRCVIWTPRGRHAPEELVSVLERRGFSVAHARSAHEAVGELCALACEGRDSSAARPGAVTPDQPADDGGRRDADGPGSARGAEPRIIVLILTEPTKLEQLPAAYGAASVYGPRLDSRVVCWWFDEPSRRLRAADASDIARWGAGLPVVVKAGAGGPRRVMPSQGKDATIGPPAPGTAQQADDVTEAFLGKARPSLRLAGEGTLPPGRDESENARPGDIPPPTGGMGGLLTGEELAMLLDPDPPGRAFRTE